MRYGKRSKGKGFCWWEKDGGPTTGQTLSWAGQKALPKPTQTTNSETLCSDGAWW